MSQSVLPVILLSHFIAALVALGMPPFFGLILTDTFAVEHTLWVGWFYVIPTVCTAVAAPFWGKMADRFGRRWSLLRAQVGLSVAFIVAGLAPDVITFAVALMVQGFLGGTFAASSAYLSTVARGQNLAESLNWMQGSARSAMILAPILLGFFITRVPAQHLYLYMAILPLISALLVWKLAPRDPVLGRPDGQKHAREKASASAGWLRLRLLYFGFNFALVASFPYFIPWTQARTGMTAAMAGVLYSLPHALYLLILVSPLRRSQCFGKPWVLPAGLALFALSYVIQATAGTTFTVLAGRWIMGLGMTTCLFALNAETASLTRMENAGQSFGVLDSAGKWAGVAAGVLAGVATGMSSQTAPFWLGAGVTLLTITLSVYRPNRSRH
ncbi:MAG: MFS transporter [Gammaproteobacteria bacterium]|nr:MAG: MFS transporter [Gammaproteobacteria bacterium]